MNEGSARAGRLRAYIARAAAAPMEPLPRVERPADGGVGATRAFYAAMASRRSVRAFRPDPVPWETIATAVAVAGTAPSGANLQPWTFVVVADPALKAQMRDLIEREERETYERRATDEWLDALAPLGTDWHKEHITIAPYVIVVFAQAYGIVGGADGGERERKHYYVSESVGIAVGLLLASFTLAGLATLTHTPNPMGFLATLLERPRNERAYIVIPVGYPAENARVPAIRKKPLDDILIRR